MYQWLYVLYRVRSFLPIPDRPARLTPLLSLCYRKQPKGVHARGTSLLEYRQFRNVALSRLLSGRHCHYYCSPTPKLHNTPIMSSSNLYRSQNGNPFGGSTNRASTPTNFTGLLARSEALGANNSNQDAGNSSELPQIHYGIGEIERQSEMVAGKGKRKAVRGEG